MEQLSAIEFYLNRNIGPTNFIRRRIPTTTTTATSSTTTILDSLWIFMR